MTETVVERVVQVLVGGEAVAAVARAYGPGKRWAHGGDWVGVGQGCRGSIPTGAVGSSTFVLYPELCKRGFTGSVIIVRRAVVPLRQSAAPRATVRFATAPDEQAHVDFGHVRASILRVSLVFCGGVIGRVSHARIADTPPTELESVLRLRYLMLLVTDLAEHYAQLADYMRQLVLLPPSALLAAK